MADRRSQVRARTYQEIRQAARDLLVAEGVQAVTINAVARRMGMSGPAIYRYYDSHDDLIAGLTAEFYHEVTAAVADARVPGAVNLVPMSRALRRWATTNRAGFRMIFASPPLPQPPGPATREDRKAAIAFGALFFDEVAEIWDQKGFPTPKPASVAPALRHQLERYTVESGNRMPPEAVYVFLNCWIRLYGHLCIEVLHQIEFAISDAAPLFEDCLRELCGWLDIRYYDENAG
ncbi:TetR/AcrR family transcriptional regulator [Roseinatronobacter alkalisoli]|uniref:TetR/AcrR family transcriptional regulator n=1 Tax=Roseinatronobacter alkalisoli TaxID=3028235 RepID=A0ABT5T6S8_9RHOB|nr:TetR/AcrR family transcriptional regulator [Roseinatronobacter sp. HJB301]MDD7970827.1 TetR/AcrR family transcriptional regulator [Roseinatronobacter sp. HJB301]